MLTEMAAARPTSSVRTGRRPAGTMGEIILQQPDISRLTAVVLSANDRCGVADQTAARALRNRTRVVTGPATDNSVGSTSSGAIERPAFNAISNPVQLGDFVIGSSPQQRRERSGRGVTARTPPSCWAAPATWRELLRLIAGTPARTRRHLVGQPAGSAVAAAFRTCAAPIRISPSALDDIERGCGSSRTRRFLGRAARRAGGSSIGCSRRRVRGAQTHCVDISADFRYPSAGAYESYTSTPIRALAHREFTCASRTSAALADAACVPSGCFATATLLATVPLLALD